MSIFDNIAKATFSTVENIMGDVAIWVRSTDSIEQTETVLFNSPDLKQTIGDIEKYDYSEYNYWFEYYEGQFVNLKQDVDNGNIEKVIISGKELNVRQVITKFDGKTYIAFCELVDEVVNGYVING